MSESRTQQLLNNYCDSICKNCHPQQGDKEIFKTLKPDGWFIDNHLLIIFECKRTKQQYKTEAKQQLMKYIATAEQYAETNELDIIPVFVYGTTEKTFTMLYVEDFDEPIFKNFVNVYKPTTMITYDVFNPHEFNDYIYNNFPQISSNERMLIIVCVLLAISVNIDLTPPIELKCLNVERSYGMSDHFNFIMEKPYSIALNECVKYFQHVKREQLSEVLMKCFTDISYWSFKTSQGKNIKRAVIGNEGAVLTPIDIVNLMINECDIKPFDVVCDPCCGTGSFLINSACKTKTLIGNELDLTRSIVAKHGLLISHITDVNMLQIDCLNPDYKPSFDWLLMNPPYDHQNEQLFCLKFIKLAKKGGAVIIPIGNFRNEKFKHELCSICNPTKLIILNNQVFAPTIVQTAILVFNKSKSDLKVYDFTNDGFIVKPNVGRLFDHFETMKMIKTITSADDSWEIDSNDIDRAETVEQLIAYLKLELIKRHTDRIYLKLIRSNAEFGETVSIEPLKLPVVDVSHVKWFKFNECFQFIDTTKCSTIETVPLFGATRDNIPQKEVNYYVCESSNDHVVMTINSTGDGGCGICHVMNGRFAVSSRYCFIKRTTFNGIINYEITAIMMSYFIHNVLKYNRAKGVGRTTFNETLPVYVE